MNKRLIAAVTAATVLYNLIPSVVAGANWIPGTLPSSSVGDVIQGVLNMLLFIVVIAAVVYISLAGLKYVTSQGDVTKAKEAQAAITNAVIGLVVAFVAYFIVIFVLERIGVNSSDFDTISQVLFSGFRV